MGTKKSSIETRGIVKKYLEKGLGQSEIARLLGVSRQAVNYWVQIIRQQEKYESRDQDHS